MVGRGRGEGGKEEIGAWTALKLVGLGERQRDGGRREPESVGENERRMKVLGGAECRVISVTLRLKSLRCLPPLTRIRKGQAVLALTGVFVAQ